MVGSDVSAALGEFPAGLQNRIVIAKNRIDLIDRNPFHAVHIRIIIQRWSWCFSRIDKLAAEKRGETVEWLAAPDKTVRQNQRITDDFDAISRLFQRFSHGGCGVKFVRLNATAGEKQVILFARWIDRAHGQQPILISANGRGTDSNGRGGGVHVNTESLNGAPAGRSFCVRPTRLIPSARRCRRSLRPVV